MYHIDGYTKEELLNALRRKGDDKHALVDTSKYVVLRKNFTDKIDTDKGVLAKFKTVNHLQNLSFAKSVRSFSKMEYYCYAHGEPECPPELLPKKMN